MRHIWPPWLTRSTGSTRPSASSNRHKPRRHSRFRGCLLRHFTPYPHPLPHLRYALLDDLTKPFFRRPARNRRFRLKYSGSRRHVFCVACLPPRARSRWPHAHGEPDCMPSCQHVVLFTCSRSASASGFRDCTKVRPVQPVPANGDYKPVGTESKPPKGGFVFCGLKMFCKVLQVETRQQAPVNQFHVFTTEPGLVVQPLSRASITLIEPDQVESMKSD